MAVVNRHAGCSCSVLLVVIYRFVPPPITATMVGDVVAGRGLKKDWMSLDEMDRDMVRAAIGAEDSKFCQHNGFDIEAIEDAMKHQRLGRPDPRRFDDQPADDRERLPVAGGGYFRKGVKPISPS